jgi:hypothetical protein
MAKARRAARAIQVRARRIERVRVMVVSPVGWWPPKGPGWVRLFF